MACYLISEIEWLDTGPMQRYLHLVALSKQKYGGRYLVRGGDPRLLEGSGDVRRMVVTEFDSVEHAMRWWNSPEYAEAKAIRQPVTRCRVVLVDGVSERELASAA
ncbi:DUF1330 domain-containing protein [Pigmentiphaga kullae]|uniref:Uncharacterized protein (DUF1330 family) n=1 Tax=Pigmentiphaga kullae TaxID=151784 RepID=A0A4Q7NMA1_9BURK|nr:DUF1330 domain-containing protein [Pigmentiphaga kullae]RZS86305.1 uncharacterized protein (DUF1330 family) [Pigmentiphaga kullae]